MLLRYARRCAVVVLLLLFLSACHTVRDSEYVDGAVAFFHQQMTAGEYDQIYDGAAADFKKTVDKETFRKFCARLNRKLGKPVKTSRISYSENYSLRTTVNTVYRTQFSKGEVTEIYTWRIDKSVPYLVGYLPQSPLLMTD